MTGMPVSFRETESGTGRLHMVEFQTKSRLLGPNSCQKAPFLPRHCSLAIALILLCIICYAVALRPIFCIQSALGPSTALWHHVIGITLPRLGVVQVAPPVSAHAKENCKSTLMIHDFAFSYGQPFIGKFNPRLP